jgi:hypothetical protein
MNTSVPPLPIKEAKLENEAMAVLVEVARLTVTGDP